MWVNVNLPWDLDPDSPLRREQGELGTKYLFWYRDERARKFPGGDLHWDYRRIERTTAAAPELLESTKYSDPAWLLAIETRYKHPDILDLALYRHRSAQASEWLAGCPETVEFQARNLLLDNRIRTGQFTNHPACKPGVLVQVQFQDGRILNLLIGDILDDGGDCGDSGMPYGTIVLKYLDLRTMITKLQDC